MACILYVLQENFPFLHIFSSNINLKIKKIHFSCLWSGDFHYKIVNIFTVEPMYKDLLYTTFSSHELLIKRLLSSINFSSVYFFRWLECLMTLQQWRKKNDKANNVAVLRHTHTEQKTHTLFHHFKLCVIKNEMGFIWCECYANLHLHRNRSLIPHSYLSRSLNLPFPHLVYVHFNFWHGNFMFSVIYHSHNDSFFFLLLLPTNSLPFSFGFFYYIFFSKLKREKANLSITSELYSWKTIFIWH